jgi:hypothetical protein
MIEPTDEDIGRAVALALKAKGKPDARTFGKWGD